LLDSEHNVIPHEHVVFKLSRGQSTPDVTLRSAEWAVITQVDGQKSLADIAGILALSSDEAINLFNGLYEKGILEIYSTRKPEEKTAPQSFFTNLEQVLIQIIGPVAPLLIEDALWDMEAEKDQFKTERVPELIEVISDEITDEQKKVKFQQVMLEEIKRLY